MRGFSPEALDSMLCKTLMKPISFATGDRSAKNVLFESVRPFRYMQRSHP